MGAGESSGFENANLYIRGAREGHAGDLLYANELVDLLYPSGAMPSPNAPDVDCSDFPAMGNPQGWYFPGDPHRLDSGTDEDGASEDDDEAAGSDNDSGALDAFGAAWLTVAVAFIVSVAPLVIWGGAISRFTNSSPPPQDNEDNGDGPPQ